MWKKSEIAHRCRQVPSGLGRRADMSPGTDAGKFPLAHMVAFQHAILHPVSRRNGIQDNIEFNVSAASSRKSLYSFHYRRPKIAELLRSGARRYEINSATRDFSSFNSATEASILARLKSFIGSPCTVSHFPLRTLIGNEEINSFSTL